MRLKWTRFSSSTVLQWESQKHHLRRGLATFSTAALRIRVPSTIRAKHAFQPVVAPMEATGVGREEREGDDGGVCRQASVRCRIL